MVVGLKDNPNDSQKQESAFVIQSIGGSGKHVPITWSVPRSSQFTKENSEFLNSFGNPNTGMIWGGYDIRLSSPYPLQASILSKPVFFLKENIVNTGSLSASGKLIIGDKKKRFLNMLDRAAPDKSPLQHKKKSSLIKDGKIDMDLILIISAGVSGLILILIPERKRKRDLIKEANLALLRRPRQ